MLPPKKKYFLSHAIIDPCAFLNEIRILFKWFNPRAYTKVPFWPNLKEYAEYTLIPSIFGGQFLIRQEKKHSCMHMGFNLF